MAGDLGKAPFYRDDEIVMDRDGIPHYTGAEAGLMKDYRRRVLFTYSNLEGEGKDEAEERKDLQKKQQRFAKRLLDNLHGVAWEACRDLIVDNAKLRAVDGYKHVLQALQSIEKTTVVRQNEAFDKFFKQCHRKKGQSLDEFLRQRKQDWSDLTDLSDGTSMTDDLKAYFLLEHINLPREDRRQILLANNSVYTTAGFEKTLRISFYDVHEREKSAHRDWQGKGSRRSDGRYKKAYAHQAEGESAEELTEESYFPEESYFDEEPFAVEEAYYDEEEASPSKAELSDCGASDDEEVFEAYATMDKQRKTYQESRKKLKDLQRSRGFYKGDLSTEERQKALAEEKKRSRCGSCGRLGHWAGDADCPNGSRSGPYRKGYGKKGKSGKKGGAKKGKGKAFFVSDGPMFFSLTNSEDLEEFCNMVQEQGENDMEQDQGSTELDGKRRNVKPLPRVPALPSYATSQVSQSDWEHVGEATPSTPWVGVENVPQLHELADEVSVKAREILFLQVESLEEVRPADLERMKLRELATECDNWNLQTSGTKEVLLKRLLRFFNGEAINKKGCSKRFIQLQVRKEVSKSHAAPGSQRTGSESGSMSRDPGPSSSHLTQGPILFSPRAAPKSFPRTPEHRGYTTTSPGEGSNFRSYKVDEVSLSPQMLQETPKRDPRTGINVPNTLEVGRNDPRVLCMDCGSSMVLRRNRGDGGLFFGCSRYGKIKGCSYTRKFDEGLQILAAVAGRR